MIPRTWIDISPENTRRPTVGEIITNHVKALGATKIQLAKRGYSVTYTLKGKRHRRWWTIGNNGSGLYVTLEPKMR